VLRALFFGEESHWFIWVTVGIPTLPTALVSSSHGTERHSQRTEQLVEGQLVEGQLVEGAALPSLLDWSAKQARLLTGGGAHVAERLYSADNGFPFLEEELPHHHLLNASMHAVFARRSSLVASALESGAPEWMCGAWSRPLFVGGWEHSDDRSDACFNVQTPSLFVDLRIPTARRTALPSALFGAAGQPAKLASAASPLSSLPASMLHVLARQHAFGGFTVCEPVEQPSRSDEVLCTRHHCIDWNFVGVPRRRPNKWRAQPRPRQPGAAVHEWKEWSFARDEHGQSYYMEMWRRLTQPHVAQSAPRLALRATASARDALVVIVGDHFNYLLDRIVTPNEAAAARRLGSSLVQVVDAALDANERQVAEAYLSMQAGHGCISSGWRIDASLQPWHEGATLFEILGNSVHAQSVPTQAGASWPDGCQVQWNGKCFDVFSSSFASVAEIEAFLSPGKS